MEEEGRAGNMKTSGGGSYSEQGTEEERLEALNKFRTATSVSMSPELFEKLYLSPKNHIKGELRQTFGNPSPIGLAGFLICLTPLSMDLMGWRGAGGNGAASIGSFFFQGGFLMNLGCILEWVLGNTFPAVVFGVYGTFWLAHGATLNPSFAAYALYAPPGRPAAEGLRTQGFNASVAWWFLFMGLISLIFFICALRTNVCLCFIFFCLTISYALQTAGKIKQAEDYHGNEHLAHTLGKAAGGMLFAACWSGWYILLGELLAAVDFPIQVCVGDLSTVIKGRRERMRSKES
ncbi:hypothetical protein CDD83_11043 [Cordyceps sp. RAO-2017]|nr:hypothetical protein CDD83_11043 [Cordyceps sp. RAO-2017]